MKAGDTATGRTLPLPLPCPADPRSTISRWCRWSRTDSSVRPRYRQVVREVTLGLARPVWVDDRDFDINFHIRRSGLPRPGGPTDLAELISRVMSRPLDRTRPLWEMYLIEGLADGRLAILTKSHRCLIDGPEHPEISEVICDDTDTPESLPEELWMPGSPAGNDEPGHRCARRGDGPSGRPGRDHGARQRPGVRGAFGGRQHRPAVRGRRRPAHRLRSPPQSAQQLGYDDADLHHASVPRRDCAKIADHHNCTVTDVELAIISGVMRRWMLSVDPATVPADTVRVVIPLSTRDPVWRSRRSPNPAGSVSANRAS